MLDSRVRQFELAMRGRDEELGELVGKLEEDESDIVAEVGALIGAKNSAE
jgi:hypothetical protein